MIQLLKLCNNLSGSDKPQKGSIGYVMGRRIIDFWEKANLGGLETITYLFTFRALEYESLYSLYYFFKDIYPEISYIDHMRKLFRYDDTPETIMACRNLTDTYFIKDAAIFRQLLDEADFTAIISKNYSRYVSTFLLESLKIYSDYAEKPYWILSDDSSEQSDLNIERDSNVEKEQREVEEENKMSVLFDLAIQLSEEHQIKNEVTLNDNDIITILIDNMSESRMISEEKERIATQVYLSIEEDKREDYAKPFIEALIQRRLYFDEYLFQIFGPCNPSPDRKLCTSSDNICEMFGGDRMFLCRDKEIYNDTINYDQRFKDQHNLDWFGGNCLECGLKILKKHYALRLPLINGGWQGCYCNFECLEIAGMFTIRSHTFMPYMIETMKRQFNKYGILEREWDYFDQRGQLMQLKSIKVNEVEIPSDTFDTLKELEDVEIKRNDTLALEFYDLLT